MPFYYSDPANETDHNLPNIEVFYAGHGQFHDVDDEPNVPGWYYWACFPGCLPDSDPVGPYGSESEAICAAREE